MVVFKQTGGYIYGICSTIIRGAMPHAKNYLRQYWSLYLMLVLPIAFFIVFRYIPMTYIQIAL